LRSQHDHPLVRKDLGDLDLREGIEFCVERARSNPSRCGESLSSAYTDSLLEETIPAP
jgi:hypothetical protein